MKVLTFLAGALCLAGLPTVASASCFYVFSAQNQLVYRSILSPVDLSRPISEGMKGRFSGGHLTMTPDETGCPDLIASTQNQAAGIFGFSNNDERSVSAADVKPVLRNMKSLAPDGSTYDPLAAPQGSGAGRTGRRSTSGSR
jgi:hypothetical protein